MAVTGAEIAIHTYEKYRNTTTTSGPMTRVQADTWNPIRSGSMDVFDPEGEHVGNLDEEGP